MSRMLENLHDAAPLIAALFVFYAFLFFFRKIFMRRSNTAPARRKWQPTHNPINIKLFSSNAASQKLKKANYIARNLLNNSEKQFFRLLVEAFPEHYIFSQVSFNALVTHASHIWNQEWLWRVRRKFNTKYVDYVVCEKSNFEVVAIVEYDGKGHKSHDDERRDELLIGVGYRVERFSHKVTIDEIRTRFGNNNTDF